MRARLLNHRQALRIALGTLALALLAPLLVDQLGLKSALVASGVFLPAVVALLAGDRATLVPLGMLPFLKLSPPLTHSKSILSTCLPVTLNGNAGKNRAPRGKSWPPPRVGTATLAPMLVPYFPVPIIWAGPVSPRPWRTRLDRSGRQLRR